MLKTLLALALVLHSDAFQPPHMLQLRRGQKLGGNVCPGRAISSPRVLVGQPRRSVAVAGMKMKLTAQDGDVVGVVYKGTFDDGEVFDENLEGPPLQFEVGSGNVIKGFDKAVRGLGVGESRKVRCDPEDAYGKYDDENVATVPADRMPDPPPNMSLEPGLVLQLANGQVAVVKEVGPETVVLDGNHPLAGKTLNFDVTLKSIMDREKALEAKLAELDSILSNPIMAMLAAEVTKNPMYVKQIKDKIDGAEDKNAAIKEILESKDWRTINMALMNNPQLLELMKNPMDSIKKMADEMEQKELADKNSNVVEADFGEDK